MPHDTSVQLDLVSGLERDDVGIPGKARYLAELGIRYSLIRYFNEAIRYRYSATFQKFAISYSLFPLNSVIGFI
jgi:hypothetical protein